MYLIIDTETTGLPKTMGFDQWYPPVEHDKYDSARLVQVAWKVLDDRFNELYSKNYIVRRDEFSIDNSEFHGITNEISDNKGIHLNTIFEDLYTSLLECEYIVAHNIAFDENVILNHTYRIEDNHLRDRWYKMNRVCTMKITRDVVKLVGKWGKYKYPSLKELYHYYFNETFEGAHDAMNDVNACGRCFVEYWKNKTKN